MYIALTALFIGAVVIASAKFVSSFARMLLIAGGLSIGYGLLQTIGADPIKWVNQYSPVIGFLGNPNFQSAFMGITAAAGLTLAVFGQMTLSLRLSLFVLVAVAIRIAATSWGPLVSMPDSSVRR